ncbi:hypothetical protein GW17_00021712 [Ensete ventricosum]|nr:hypothetical protein GW17_00021712 [Ensete ventricosum]RZS03682.1 hypothetical protein BHM03_00033889 [Ensete ventricosum]
MQQIEASSVDDGLAFIHSFLPPLLLPCAIPSTIKGEDRSFLYHRRTSLKLPPPMTSPFAAFAAVITAVSSFLHIRGCNSQLPPWLPPSTKSFSVTTTLSFPTFHCQ